VKGEPFDHGRGGRTWARRLRGGAVLLGQILVIPKHRQFPHGWISPQPICWRVRQPGRRGLRQIKGEKKRTASLDGRTQVLKKEGGRHLVFPREITPRASRGGGGEKREKSRVQEVKVD